MAASFRLRASITAFCALAVMISSARSFATPISWASAVNGNWNDPTKWSPAQVPGLSDDVTINVPGTYTVTLNADASINSLALGDVSATQTLSGSGRILTLASASTIAAGGVLDLTSSSINGAGSLTIQGRLALRAENVAVALDNFGLILGHGTFTLSGALTTETGSTFRAEGDALSGAANVTVTNGFTNNGTIELTNV